MGRGRPRKTDPNTVLNSAMKVFWDQGFEGTSLKNLVEATGMAKPGLYATFGDKEALYAKALTHYVDLFSPHLDDLIDSTDALDVVIRRFLNAVASSVIKKESPKGCFVVNSVVECACKPPSLEVLGKTLEEKRRSAFVKRFKTAVKCGELPADTDATAIANFFDGQCLALAIMGRAGANQKKLHQLIDVAMTVLHGNSESH